MVEVKIKLSVCNYIQVETWSLVSELLGQSRAKSSDSELCLKMLSENTALSAFIKKQ